MFVDALKKLWNRKRQPSTATTTADTPDIPDDPPGDLDTPDSLLASALLQHHLPSHREGMAHVLPGGLRLTPLAHDFPSPAPGNCVVAFELRAQSARTNGKVISSGVAGLGETVNRH